MWGASARFVKCANGVMQWIFRKMRGISPPGLVTTAPVDGELRTTPSGIGVGIGERIASCVCVMSADSLRESLFTSAPDSAVKRALSFGRLALVFARRTLCALRGHDMLQHFEPERLSLRCVGCGTETRGWRIDVDPRFRGRQRRLTARRQGDFPSTRRTMVNLVRQETGPDSTAPRAA